MPNTIGVCGYCYTGSSAVTDLLNEFDDACVLDELEFSITYYPDGLDDLDWHLNINYGKHFNTLPIHRFRKLAGSRGFMRKIDRGKRLELLEIFMRKIVQVRWIGLSAEERDRFSWLFRRSICLMVEKITKRFTPKNLPKLYYLLTCRKLELSVRPPIFDEAAREYVGSLLDAMGRDIKKVTVLNQPFCGNIPLKSFKYFINPKAIIVDRDPRDIYLLCKMYLRNRGDGLQIAINTVDEFIAWFKASHIEPNGLRERDDILFINFEELVYDYENAIHKISKFCGVNQHTEKGKHFQPSRSCNNTQAFKRFSGYEQDIIKIEQELTTYLFPFHLYPDIEAEGTIFV